MWEFIKRNYAEVILYIFCLCIFFLGGVCGYYLAHESWKRVYTREMKQMYEEGYMDGANDGYIWGAKRVLKDFYLDFVDSATAEKLVDSAWAKENK